MLTRLRNLSRFSLRTFFVLVTLLAIGLGWLCREWRIVRERNAVLTLMDPLAPPHLFSLNVGVRSEPLWIRRMLGEKPAIFVRELPENEKDRDRVLAAFPEAEVFQWNGELRTTIDRNTLKFTTKRD